MDGELTAHITTGATVVYLIEWLKQSRLVPFITQETKAINRIISAILAAAMALGINWTYDASSGDLVIHGLTVATVASTGWEWLKQFVMQQVTFDAVVARHRKDTP